MRTVVFCLAFALLVGCQSQPARESDGPKPPIAEARPYTHEIHGDHRTDPYFWLRDDARSNPEVLAYLEAENDYLQAVMQPLAPLQATLYEEMVARTPARDEEPPVQIGAFLYYRRYEPGQEHPVYLRRPADGGAEEVLLDANELAEGHEYYRLGRVEVSDDHRYLAFAEDVVSRRQYRVRIKDLRTGRILDDLIPNTSGALAWAADNRTLFYVAREPQTLLPYQVYRHTLGEDTNDDVLVYEEEDDTFYTSLWRSPSGKWIYIHSSHTLSDEFRLVDARRPAAEPVVFLERERGHEHHVLDAGGRFYVITNEGAVNFRIIETDLESRADRATWTERVPHREDVFIDDAAAFDDYLVVNERSEGLRRIVIHPRAGGAPYVLDGDEAAFTMWLDKNPTTRTTRLRYGYSSLATPDSVYEIDMATRARTLLKRDEVVGDFSPQRYQTERFFIPARDGTLVPVSVVYARGETPPSQRPLLVYGYGSYGYSRDPNFSLTRLSLLDRGFVFAIAHVRGGQELGRAWYEAGKMFNKQNTFNDFVDVTRALVARGIGDPERVYALGGSAGGLLMGAVINQAPELYHGVVAAVPFVDVVTTMLDESIPLTTGEFDEWGNPKIAEQYHYMLSYSPYDQVRAQDYPHILITTGLHDSQVQYWEPAKWAAKLRAMRTDDDLLLLYTDMSAGHSGGAGRFQRYEDAARHYAFLIGLATGALP